MTSPKLDTLDTLKEPPKNGREKHETPHVGFLDTTKLPKTKGSMSCPKGLGVFQGKNSLETEKNQQESSKRYQNSSKTGRTKVVKKSENRWENHQNKKCLKFLSGLQVTVIPNCFCCRMFFFNTQEMPLFVSRSLKPLCFTRTILGIIHVASSKSRHLKYGMSNILTSLNGPRHMKISGCPTTSGCKTGLFPTAT